MLLTVDCKSATRCLMAAKKKARSYVYTLRLSEEEHRLFNKVAAKYGLDVSSMLRMVVKQDAQRGDKS